MKNLSLCLILTLSVLFSCKDKPTEPVKEIEKPETLAPLKPLADTDLVELSPEFEAFLIKEKIDPDANANGSIRYGLVKNVDSLNIFMLGSKRSVKGLEYFTNLRSLSFDLYQVPTDNSNNYSWATGGANKEYRAPIDTLDVRYNVNLEYLNVSGKSDGGGYKASIGFLKLGDNTKLKTLISQFGMMNQIDLSGLVNLENLDLSDCYSLKSLSFCTNSKLKNLIAHRAEKLYVPDPNKVDPALAERAAGATFYKCL
ncbi:hypothetical protein [Dyadobacter luticola]|uniref:Leucine-rich repeat domain-containing protein n=1 Tax=Dyadobacter luticola TaxID=1979387 RepID=A0A5R9L210_9BACT|nr:hypothetical protein [Dyadobacter luticola]TLV02563.1 hypothetical protein FEN17_02775 [Dyadobacter luticola]